MASSVAMRRWHTARERLRIHGWAGAWELFRDNFYATNRCFRLRLDLNAPNPASTSAMPAPAELRVEQGHLETLAQLRAATGHAKLPGDFYEDRTRGLSHFYLGYWRDQVAHILWLAHHGEASTVSGWQPNPEEVEVRNVHTLAAFRRHGIFSHVARTVLQELHAAGMRMAYAHVNESNRASLQAFQRLGFVPLQMLRTWRFLGVDYIRSSAPDPTKAARDTSHDLRAAR